MMANANFITQFEYRLNNLANEDEYELRALRATADKYTTDLDPAAVANLDSAINDDADALTNSSTVDELSAIGQAAAEIKSGGSGLPIGTIQPIRKKGFPKIITDTDGSVWLRTGTLHTDTENYPELDSSIYSLGLEVPAPSIEAPTTSYSMTTICVVGDNLWTTRGSSFGYPAILTMEGEFVEEITSYGDQAGYILCIRTSGTEIFILRESVDRIDVYDMGHNLLRQFSIQTQETNPYGMCYKDGHIYVVGNNRKAFEYTVAGVYTGNNYPVTAGANTPQSIEWDGEYFVVCDDSSTSISRYDAAFVFVDNLVGVVSAYDIAYDPTSKIMYTVKGSYRTYRTNSDFTALYSLISKNDTATSASAFCTDGTHLYLFSTTVMYKFTLTGDFVEETTLSNTITILRDATYLDGHFYIVGHVNQMLKYDMSGNRLDVWNVPSTADSLYSIINKDGYLYVGTTGGDVYKATYDVSAELFSTVPFSIERMVEYKGVFLVVSYYGDFVEVSFSGDIISILGETTLTGLDGLDYINDTVYFMDSLNNVYTSDNVTDVVGDPNPSFTGENFNYLKGA